MGFSKVFSQKYAKRLVVESLGWLLVALGLAALVLPGPGLLALFAGLALLSTQYEWAAKRVKPVRKAALKAAAESVSSWPRIALSVFFCLALIALGIVWGLHPAEPAGWSVPDNLWLVGGWGTGGTLIFSGVIAFAMIIYSYLNFRNPK
jgi:hypothetical protein